MAYIGKGLDNGVRNQFIFAATQGQTAFSGADSDGKTLAISDILYTDCFQNGVKLEPTTDYTVTLTSLTLVSAASLNDVVDIVSFDIFAVPDTVPASTGGTFGGGITATGGTFGGGITATTGTFSGAVSGTTISGSVTSGTTSTFTSTQAATNADILKLNATQTNSSSNLKFQINGGSTAQAQIRLGGNNDISIHNTSSDTERVRILAGGGITFNGDTAAANAIDDYEEGTWTAAFTATSGSITINQSAGTYTKIGRQVTVSGAFTVGSVSSNSGDMGITGLPFTSGSGTGFSTSAAMWLNSINTQEGKTIQSRMDANNNQLFIFDLAGGNSAGAAAYFKANSVINISLTYFTA